MKFIAIAIIAVVRAADPAVQPVGTACSVGGTTACGPVDTTCCGIATMGMVDNADGTASKQAVPNAIICNSNPTAADWKATIYSTGAGDTLVEIKATYPKAGFTCLSGASALVASAAAAFTLASMI